MSCGIPSRQQLLAFFVVDVPRRNKECRFDLVCLKCRQNRAIALTGREPDRVLPGEIIHCECDLRSRLGGDRTHWRDTKGHCPQGKLMRKLTSIHLAFASFTTALDNPWQTVSTETR